MVPSQESTTPSQVDDVKNSADETVQAEVGTGRFKIGDRVVVSGLNEMEHSEYNGRFASVKDWDAKKEAWIVEDIIKDDPELTKTFPDDVLHKVLAKDSREDVADAMKEFYSGDRVLIKGLESEAGIPYNYTYATIKAWYEKQRVWHVYADFDNGMSRRESQNTRGRSSQMNVQKVVKGMPAKFLSPAVTTQEIHAYERETVDEAPNDQHLEEEFRRATQGVIQEQRDTGGDSDE